MANYFSTFKMYPHRSKSFNGCSHETIVLCAEIACSLSDYLRVKYM